MEETVNASHKKGSSFLVLKHAIYVSSSDEELRTYDDSSYCNLTVLTEDEIEEASEESDGEEDEDASDDEEDTMSDDTGYDVACSNQKTCDT